MDERGAVTSEAEELFRLVAESAEDYAIFTTDLGRRVLSWNTGAARLMGYGEPEIVGRCADIIFTPEDRDRGAPEDEVRRALAEGRAEDERWHVRKDGTRFWGSGQLIPLRAGGGPPRGFAKILRDRTERKRADDTLRRAREEMEARVQERTAELSQVLISLETETTERARTEQARRELLRRLVTAQEDERRRISRELHDEMGQHITALSLELRLLSDSIPEGHPARDRLERLKGVTGRIGREVHKLALELRPTALDDLGLETTLLNHLDEWSERSGVAADFHAAGFEDGGRAPSHVETVVYRVVQEALTNVARHAGAARVAVVLERGGGGVHLIVEDDGRGFDPDALDDAPDSGQRLGLLGMRERVAMVGGTLTVESREGGPTTLYVRVPMSPGGGEGRHG